MYHLIFLFSCNCLKIYLNGSVTISWYGLSPRISVPFLPFPFFCSVSRFNGIGLNTPAFSSHRYDSRNAILEWSILLIDNSNRRSAWAEPFFIWTQVFYANCILQCVCFLTSYWKTLQWIYGICCPSCRFISLFPDFSAFYCYKYI